MSRQSVRLGAALLSAVLIALAAFVAPALGGDTRLVYIGDPDGTNGSLSFTRTAPGGLSSVTIQVRNDGTQTLNHATLRGGYAADTSPVNALYPPPPGPSLPEDLSYVAVYSSAPCTIGPDGVGVAGRSLSCDLGTLPAGASKTVLVVIQTPPGGDATFSVWFGVYLAEGNATGSNQDNFYAQGTLATTTPICSADPNKNKDANYFLPTEAVDLFSQSCESSGAPRQDSSLNSGGNQPIGGNGTYGEVSLEPFNSLCSDIGLTCYGDAIVTNLDAQPVPGGVQWKARWYGTRSLYGVIHFLDTYIAGHPDFGDDYVVIPFKKQWQCGKNLSTDCWVVTAASKGNEIPSWFEATWITGDNGRGGGLF